MHSRSMLVALAVCIFLLASASTLKHRAHAAQSASTQGSADQKLTQLEDKLFEHNYPSEDEARRLHRLEQFVFGDDQTGSLNDRLSHLQSTLAKNEPKDIAPSPQQTSPPVQVKQQVATAGQNTQSTSSFPTFDYGSYPRVTDLEKHLLGKTYVNDALPDRVARLETKAFGKVSSTDDLGERVDRLDQYTHRHDLFKERDIAPQMASDQPFMSQAPNVAAAAEPPVNPFVSNQMASGSAQRTTVMEQAVFGRSYPNRPLEERLARLEKKIVPYEHNLSAKNLPTRVDNLWSILSPANTLNTSPLSPGNRNSIIGAAPMNQPGGGGTDQNDGASGSNSSSGGQPAQANSGHQSWLHKLSKMVTSPSATPVDNGYYKPPTSYSGPMGVPGASYFP